MPVAWWENQCGLYFQLETTARKACATPTPDDPNGIRTNIAYGEKVMVLEWIAAVLDEPEQHVMRECLADPTALWRSLSLMQRRHLSQKKAAVSSDFEQSYGTDIEARKNSGGRNDEMPRVVPQMERRLKLNELTPEESITYDGGTILIPAATCDTETHNDNVIIMDSFLGGKQVFLNHDGKVDYTLSGPPGGKYKLSCRFVTVHDEKVKSPLQVTIASGETCTGLDDNGWELVQRDRTSCYTIDLPYTKGLWDETSPISVELPKDLSSCKISLTRDKAARGMALKDIKLVP